MILLTFKTPSGTRLGIRTPSGILDVKAAAQALGVKDTPITPNAFFRRGLAALPGLANLVQQASQHPSFSSWLRAENELKMGPCMPPHGKILCVGLNYRRHAQESGMALPAYPVFFSKYSNALAAQGEAIPLPAHLHQYDYEAELAVVIGRRAYQVSQEEALSYVLGYCNANDVSERDMQTRTSQWLLGKTCNKFFPTGPYLVTADEAGSPQSFPVRCWVNGVLRQNSTTADMIFSVAQLVQYASSVLPLEPGDIISTGTPEGVGLGRSKTEKDPWLKPGDRIEVEIGPLGRLMNSTISEI